jgi:hypothetical protein
MNMTSRNGDEAKKVLARTKERDDGTKEWHGEEGGKKGEC